MNIESETKRIQDFVDKGNYHAAINIAISAMNECRRNEDRSGTDHFISMIKSIAEIIADKYGSTR